MVYNELDDLIASAAYSQMSEKDKRKAATKAMKTARDTARAHIDDPSYQLPERGQGGWQSEKGTARRSSASDNGWPGKVVDQPEADQQWPGKVISAPDDQWPGKPVAQADMVGELQSQIPGVRFTSGFRTPEYQADMRRRGYKPANNSGHLDGSALDMLPPAGKSLGWLRSQVAREHPDARLLVHDGHLHATFPDWYGAPVLGGAMNAGLVNPNARGR